MHILALGVAIGIMTTLSLVVYFVEPARSRTCASRHAREMPTVADEDADDSSWWQHANTLKRAMATIPTESLKLGHQSD